MDLKPGDVFIGLFIFDSILHSCLQELFCLPLSGTSSYLRSIYFLFLVNPLIKIRALDVGGIYYGRQCRSFSTGSGRPPSIVLLGVVDFTALRIVRRLL